MTTMNPDPERPAPPAIGVPVTITRLLNAPRDRVFAAWTDPAQVAQWWSPHGFTIPVCELDVRPGGALHMEMRAPDGALYPNDGIYHEIVPPERLVFTTHALADAAGVPQLQVLNTVTFTEEGGQTRLTLESVVLTAAQAALGALSGMEVGWRQSLEKLAEYLEQGTVTPRPPGWD